MNYIIIGSRILLGVGFIIFGTNILFPFLPMPSLDPGSYPEQFLNVMGPSGYMSFVGLIQLIGGGFVLSGRLTPLGLALLAPILVNILAFHIFLEGGKGMGAGLVFSALEIFLIYSYRSYFSQIFTAKASV